jgi:signal transduction histidine kinase
MFHDEKHVIFAVEDTGVGMNEEIQEKIFLPFFTTKDINLGTGLGLAVAHGIIISHGGTCHVTSKVGCGARFEITYP